MMDREERESVEASERQRVTTLRTLRRFDAQTIPHLRRASVLLDLKNMTKKSSFSCSLDLMSFACSKIDVPQEHNENVPGHAWIAIIAAALLLFCAAAFAADTNTPATPPPWLSQPMSLADAIRIALLQNSAILKGQSDLEAAYGLVIQTRAIALPRLRGTGSYDHTEAVEEFPFPSTHDIRPPRDEWAGNIRINQTIYQGGRS